MGGRRSEPGSPIGDGTRLSFPPPPNAEDIRWTELLWTGTSPGFSDADTLYLAAVLRDEGIPVAFMPWAPGDDIGMPGIERPSALVVAADRLEDARRVREDLFPDVPRRVPPRMPVNDWIIWDSQAVLSAVLGRESEGTLAWRRLVRGALAIYLALGAMAAIASAVGNLIALVRSTG